MGDISEYLRLMRSVHEESFETNGDLNREYPLEEVPKEGYIEQIVWRPCYTGYDDSEDLIGFDLQGRAIFPSKPNRRPPDPKIAIARERLASPGLMEFCVIVDENGRWTAYPAILPDNRTPFRGVLPGVSCPFEVEWRRNEKKEDGVIGVYSYRPEIYYWIFPGMNDKINAFSPHPELTKGWSELPKPGEKTNCWLAWVRKTSPAKSYWAAFAFLEGQSGEHRVEVPVVSIGQFRVIKIKGHSIGMVVPGEEEVSFYLEGDRVIAEISLE